MMLERMLLVVDECCDATGISRSELYRQMARGKLKFRVIAGRRRITPSDLRNFLRGE